MNDIASAQSASTDVVPPRERADYWAELMNSYHGALAFRFPDSGDFQGYTALRRTSSYQIIEWHSDAAIYYRTHQQIRRNNDDDYRLLLPDTGIFALEQSGQQGEITPGSGCLVTIDKPLEMRMTSGSGGMIMTIPRREIEHRLNRLALPGGPLDLTTGLGRIVADMATGILDEGMALAEPQLDAVATRFIDLLCMLIIGDQAVSASHLAEVEKEARAYIREHAFNPDLTVSDVARALGWSLRQVQLALRRSGTTPREVIREERLQLAMARLRSPAYSARSITDIALDVGFGSSSTFSKAFRSRFAATPSDVRYSSDGP